MQILKDAAICHRHKHKGPGEITVDPRGAQLSTGKDQGRNSRSQFTSPRPERARPDLRQGPNLRGGEGVGPRQGGRVGVPCCRPLPPLFICSAELWPGGRAMSKPCAWTCSCKQRFCLGSIIGATSCRAGPGTQAAKGFQNQGASQGLDLIQSFICQIIN